MDIDIEEKGKETCFGEGWGGLQLRSKSIT